MRYLQIFVCIKIKRRAVAYQRDFVNNSDEGYRMLVEEQNHPNHFQTIEKENPMPKGNEKRLKMTGIKTPKTDWNNIKIRLISVDKEHPNEHNLYAYYRAKKCLTVLIWAFCGHKQQSVFKSTL